MYIYVQTLILCTFINPKTNLVNKFFSLVYIQVFKTDVLLTQYKQERRNAFA